jgi:CheY-like chemotaxis protein
MGGEIDVISPCPGHDGSFDGPGSEFWFTLPLQALPPLEGADVPQALGLRGVRALVVDDNATNRRVLVKRLSGWGMRCTEALGGSGALEAIYQGLTENDPFRLAVIDMQMPKMDGATLGRKIKADPALEDLCLVILTSLGTRGETRSLAEIGFQGYLTKPVKQQELMGVLLLALEPKQDSPGQRHALATRHRVRETFSGHWDHRGKVLLVEDNPANREVALGMLRSLGLGADTAANGREAVTALKSRPYDLVLMDLQMPEMDGFEATRRIRELEAQGALSPSTSKPLNPSTPQRLNDSTPNPLPIIAMTAHALPGDRDRCLQAGMNDHIAKPVSPGVLAEVLRKWLGGMTTE